MQVAQVVDDYLKELKRRFPDLKIRKTKPWWLKAAFACLFWKPKNFWDRFTQTIGQTIYLSEKWNTFSPTIQLIILKHEAVHLEQFRQISLPIMALCYLLIAFPIGIAICRAMFEREAQDEELKAVIKYIGTSERIKEKRKAEYVESLTGPEYGWAWPFKKQVTRWFNEAWKKAIESSR